MKKITAFCIVAGFFQLALGIGLIGFNVMGQPQNAIYNGQFGIIKVDFSPVSSQVSSGSSIQFKVTVDLSGFSQYGYTSSDEYFADFSWFRDGVQDRYQQFSGLGSQIPSDSYVFVSSASGSHNVSVVIQAYPLTNNPYGFWDSVNCVGAITVSGGVTPTPTGSPYPTSTPPYPTPTPTSTTPPTTTPTTPPTPPIEQTLIMVLGVLLTVSGVVTLWLSKYF